MNNPRFPKSFIVKTFLKQVLGSAISSEWSCCGSLPEVSLSSLESCLLTLAESIYVLRLSGTGF